MGFQNIQNNNYLQVNDSLVKGFQDRLKNPYYMFTQQKPTVVTYWNINARMTTLDPATKDGYIDYGKDSPYRYNRVDNFVLYGIQRIQLHFSVTENGMEADPIEGEAVILPNTVIPVVDDCFKINYLEEKGILFKVTGVDRDTMENGNNFYKISYVLEQTDEKFENMLNTIQLVDVYEYQPSNVGTNFAVLMKKSDSDLLNRIMELYHSLQEYYINLFYKDNIQTFVYYYKNIWVYDPYIIEFMIKNRLFVNGIGDFLFLTHLTDLSHTFCIEYDSSIFHYVEKRKPQLKIKSYYPVLITDRKCTMSDRLECYYELSNNLLNKAFNMPIITINKDLQDRIIENSLYDEDDGESPIYRNIIINYMNAGSGFSITDKELDNLENMKYTWSKDLFYEIPLLMFVLYSYMGILQSTENTDPTEHCYITRK